MKNYEKYMNEYVTSLTDDTVCDFLKKRVLLDEQHCRYGEGSCRTCDIRLADWFTQEYLPQIDWSKVPVDTPVICHRSKDYNSTLKRHVKRVSNDYVITFNNGMTSHTATECTGITCWDVGLVELARPEDIKKYSI